MITYLLPAILFVQFVIFAGVLLFCMLFLGFQTLASMYFSAIGKPKVATFISISRNGLFLIPALLILPRFLGLNGVLYSSSVSDFCSLILVSTIYINGILQLNKKEKEEYSKGAVE